MRTSIFLAGALIAKAINPQLISQQSFLISLIAVSMVVSDILMFAYKTLKQPKN